MTGTAGAPLWSRLGRIAVEILGIVAVVWIRCAHWERRGQGYPSLLIGLVIMAVVFALFATAVLLAGTLASRGRCGGRCPAARRRGA